MCVDLPWLGVPDFKPTSSYCATCRIQGVAGILFFWTYMLLVFLVLLNFLLAIIVDAFSEVCGAQLCGVVLLPAYKNKSRLRRNLWRLLNRSPPIPMHDTRH